MNGRRAFITALAGLMCGGPTSRILADGRTYYVRQGGSDLSSGLSPDSALRSIQRAVALATGAGNSIIIGPGVYYEQVLIGSGSGLTASSGTEEAPNTIIADLTGAETGDAAAPVVLEGDGVREWGLRISQRDHWAVSGLTFRGQSQQAIFISSATGIDVESCTIHAPSRAGIEANDCAEIVIGGNTFTRDTDSGSCIVIDAESRIGRASLDEQHDGDDDHGEHRDSETENRRVDRERSHAWGRYKRNRPAPGETIVIESNRFAVLGGLYLASDYTREEHGRRGHGGERINGIDVNAHGDGATVHILNNIGSDCCNGINLRLEGDHATGIVANNSLAGCWIGIRVSGRSDRVLLSDNIVTHSRFAIAAAGRGSRMTISGLLTFDIGGATLLGDGPNSIVGHVENVDPRWVAPGAGNFAPDADSPAIDAGRGAAGLTTDIRGLSRPYDGDGNGDAHPDLGAYEYHPVEDDDRRLRLVEWREVGVQRE